MVFGSNVVKIQWLFLALSIAACHKKQDNRAVQSNVLGQTRDFSHESTLHGLFGDLTIGEQDSIRRWTTLKPEERALLIITADNFSAPYPAFQKTHIPYVKVQSPDIEVSSVIQAYHGYKLDNEIKTLPNDEIEQLSRLIDFFTTTMDKKACTTIVPFNPFTKKKPWLVERELSSSDPLKFELLAFPSMSRSIFVFNKDFKVNKLPLLFSVKMGTDTVIAAGVWASQESKLKGLQEHVSRVNIFNERSSIPWLLTENDVVLISDSVGINYSKKTNGLNDDDANNGVIMRSYNTILKDHSRVYVPLEKFFHLKQDKIGPYWELYGDDKNAIRLRVKDEMLKDFSLDLAEQFGKIRAIYYANGFTSKDLHGQNVLVGIPVDPSIKPRLALRDVSDHAEFPMMVHGKKSKVLASISSPNWSKFYFQPVGDVVVNKNSRVRNFDVEFREKQGFKSVMAGLELNALDHMDNAYESLFYAQEGSNLHKDVLRVRSKKPLYFPGRRANKYLIPQKTLQHKCSQRGARCSKLSL